jgi:Ca-activated chloride channel family protein
MRVAVGLALSAVMALAAAPSGAEVNVWIDKPDSTESVFGLVDVEVAVASDEPNVQVEFFLDGRALGIVAEPPYRAKVDVGHENVEHEFRVVARTPSGQTVEAIVVTPSLRVDDTLEVELQQLYVTASRNGTRVLDLERSDFRILDDGDKQEIVTFERGDIPLTAILLLDCSGSMEGERLEAALEGAGLFLEGMQGLDEAMVMLFSDRLLRSTAFTSDKEVLTSALEDVNAVGGTAINDHLFMALKRLDARQGRRVVVLFSDGADVHSVLPMEEVLHKARISQALIYWIHLQRPNEANVASFSSSWRNVEANEQEYKLLRNTIKEGGGRNEVLEEASQLGDAFAGILAELREQYVVGYYPSNRENDGKWHSVKVRLSEPDIRIRTRDGYIDY